VSKEDETWDVWYPQLGPSKALHAAVYTQTASQISWPTYRKLYIDEQRAQRELIASLASRVGAGETLTLLCSSACERESRCHRSILREMIESAVQA